MRDGTYESWGGNRGFLTAVYTLIWIRNVKCKVVPDRVTLVKKIYKSFRLLVLYIPKTCSISNVYGWK